MLMRKLLLFILLIQNLNALSQDISNLRKKEISFPLSDSLKIDSLSIIPGSMQIISVHDTLNITGFFEIDHPNAVLIPDKDYLYQEYQGKDSLIIQLKYRVFPLDLGKSYSHKSNTPVLQGLNSKATRLRIKSKPDVKPSDFPSGLNRNGSISRGIRIGTTQDMNFTSNLNLQLSGKISPNLNILASISDKNIPVQPDGYSQQINDFDKLYLRIFNDKTMLRAGDYDMNNMPGYFLKVNKQVQGLSVQHEFEAGNVKIETSSSGAVVKGKYHSFQIIPLEGNQGPYKIEGGNQEKYIQIIAGSERVFIDGQVLKRGVENDYVIDYNSAEIRFNPNQLITKDKRIQIEFEYTERSYARYLLNENLKFSTGKSNYWLNIYSEHDAKNQGINQSLGDQEKSLLASIGDQTNMAFIPGIEEIPFSRDQVLYQRKDTIVLGVQYDSIYVHSLDPEKARYRLSFSLAGSQKGNYQKIQSTANGSVYEWVAPIDGIPQGDYEPVIRLITPSKKQFISLGGEHKTGKQSGLFYEFAMSQNDINTFSKIDGEDDLGYALKIQYQANHKINRLETQTSINYQGESRHFSGIERYKSVEYLRDWNLLSRPQANEHKADFKTLIQKGKAFQTSYQSEALWYPGIFKALKNEINANADTKFLNLNGKLSLLNSADSLFKTSFLRHDIDLSKKIQSFNAGILFSGEENNWINTATDSLTTNSFAFRELSAYIDYQKKDKLSSRLSYKNRQDLLPLENKLAESSNANEIRFSGDYSPRRGQSLMMQWHHRRLNFNPDLYPDENPDNNTAARLQYRAGFLKSSIQLNHFLEYGSGLEKKNEFTYLEVTPGQGLYEWLDYNENGIKELNEFEIANFQDQASYIRIYKQGTSYQKVKNSRMGHNIRIQPAAIWQNEQGIKKFLSKFSNSFSLNIDQKDASDRFKPWEANLDDPELISYQSVLRNNVYFQKAHPAFSMEWMSRMRKNKTSLFNGAEQTNNKLQSLKISYRFLKQFQLLSTSEMESYHQKSDYFSSKNYSMKEIREEIEFIVQAGLSLRINTSYSLEKKQNTEGPEELLQHKIGATLSIQNRKIGNLSAGLKYIRIDYNSDELNNALAYAFLSGFMPGNNGQWELQFNKKVSKSLVISLNYQGRYTANGIIHTGGMQLRANF